MSIKKIAIAPTIINEAKMIAKTLTNADLRGNDCDIRIFPIRIVRLTLASEDKIFVFPINLHQRSQQVVCGALHPGSFSDQKSTVDSDSH